MAYTPEDFNRDFTRENLKLLSTAQRLQGLTVQEILAEFTLVERTELLTLLKNPPNDAPELKEGITVEFGKMTIFILDATTPNPFNLLNFIALHHAELSGKILILDKPETGLHPAEQCKKARQLAQLANLGVKIILSTYSDYFIKEINTLIMLSQNKPHIQRVKTEFCYRDDEILKPEQVKAYSVGSAIIKQSVDHLGIEAEGLDKVINLMNQIQQDIVWGQ